MATTAKLHTLKQVREAARADKRRLKERKKAAREIAKSMLPRRPTK
jgi:hypothetical protein